MQLQDENNEVKGSLQMKDGEISTMRRNMTKVSRLLLLEQTHIDLV
jgi:hypothetical protein